ATACREPIYFSLSQGIPPILAWVSKRHASLPLLSHCSVELESADATILAGGKRSYLRGAYGNSGARVRNCTAAIRSNRDGSVRDQALWGGDSAALSW